MPGLRTLVATAVVCAPGCAAFVGADFDVSGERGSSGPDGGPRETPRIHGSDAAEPVGPPSECAALATFYKDVDGDGFGGTAALQACAAPPGYVGIPGDCQDQNSLVHPGQLTQFALPYLTTDPAVSSFDYDCNGKEESAGSEITCPVDSFCDSFQIDTKCVAVLDASGRLATTSLPNATCGGGAKICRPAKGYTVPTRKWQDWEESPGPRKCH